jgi:hypothetical protein
MHVVRHDAPRKQLIPLPIKEPPRRDDLLRDALRFQSAASAAEVQLVIDVSLQGTTDVECLDGIGRAT